MNNTSVIKKQKKIFLYIENIYFGCRLQDKDKNSGVMKCFSPVPDRI